MHVLLGVAKNIQIRNVPNEVHEVYKRRAAAAGKSLQEYLLADLTAQAGRPTMQEVLDRIATRKGGRITGAEAAEMVRDERDARSWRPTLPSPRCSTLPC